MQSSNHSSIYMIKWNGLHNYVYAFVFGILLPSSNNLNGYIGMWAGGGVESMCTGSPVNGFIFKLPLNSC